jgi:uncharacterized protein YcfJ
MIRKLTTVALGILLLTASVTARADHRREDRDRGVYDYARVTEVVPIISYVEVRRPHHECWDEVVYYEEPRRTGTAGSTIVGGIVGGVIGRQFGDGRGRDAMTIVGTLVGSAIGHDAAVRRQRRDGYETYSRTEERCRTSYSLDREERVDGYQVTYRYRGRSFTTRTDTHPGERIRVRVSVTPLTGRREA